MRGLILFEATTTINIISVAPRPRSSLLLRVLLVGLPDLFTLHFHGLALLVGFLHPFYFLLHPLRHRGLVKQPLQPHSIHLQPSLPVLQQFAERTDLDEDQSHLLAHFGELLQFEVVDTYSVVFHIEVVPQFAVAFAGEIELPEIVSAVISKIEEGARFHPVADLLHDLQVFLRHDRRKHEYQSVEIANSLKWQLVFGQVAHLHLQSLLILWVLLHLIFDQADGLSRYIEPIIAETWVLPQQWKDCIANTASEFHKLADDLLLLVELLEDGDGFDFPLQVGPVLEETALVEFVELVPHLLGLFLGFLIHLLLLHHLVLLQLQQGRILHLCGQVVEDYRLLRAPKLIKFHILCLCFRLPVLHDLPLFFLHCWSYQIYVYCQSYYDNVIKETHWPSKIDSSPLRSYAHEQQPSISPTSSPNIPASRCKYYQCWQSSRSQICHKATTSKGFQCMIQLQTYI